MKLPSFNVSDRVALVTGAGRGIGLSIARTLALAGANVVIQDIDQSVAQKAADEINAASGVSKTAEGGPTRQEKASDDKRPVDASPPAAGTAVASVKSGRAIAIGGDATDLNQADTWVTKTVAEFGKIDILVNNASVQKSASFVEFPLDEMKRELDANFLMVLLLCQKALPHMQKNKWGRIINIGSIQGLSGNANMPSYSMSKAAVDNLTRALARHAGRDGVTVNCIAPGWFDTLRNEDQFNNEETARQIAERMPLKRAGVPDDVNGLALLLCAEAGSYITGQTIYVDGGMSLR